METLSDQLENSLNKQLRSNINLRSERLVGLGIRYQSIDDSHLTTTSNNQISKSDYTTRVACLCTQFLLLILKDLFDRRLPQLLEKVMSDNTSLFALLFIEKSFPSSRNGHEVSGISTDNIICARNHKQCHKRQQECRHMFQASNEELVRFISKDR